MTQTISSSELNLQNQHPDSISAVRSDEFHQNLESKEAPHVVQALVQELQIVHTTAGRIRIRATDGSSILMDTSLNSLLNAISQVGVSEATWNEQTQSLIISFDTEVLSVAQMLAILDEFGIKGQTDAASTDVFAAWKSAEFWKEQGIDLIPLFTGLVVTSGLGISGLVSIPVYMVTANVTRRAISHLQPLLTQASSTPVNNSDKISTSTNNNQTSQFSVKPSLSKLENSSTIERPRSVDAVEKVAYSVVHAIPGRVRFNVPRIAKDGAYAKRLERLINTEPHVTSVRVNSDAASIAIAYQSSELTVAHWVSLIQLADEVVVPTTQNIDTTAPIPVIPQSNHSKTASFQANTIVSTPTTQGNSIIADFRPPFLIALINLAAYYPLERIFFSN